MNTVKVNKLAALVIGIATMLVLTHCVGAPKDPQMASLCQQRLDNAFRELEQAKANGFSGSVNWSKAATLLSAAKVQQQFDKYPNCIDKVKRARYYIKESQKP
ncbi:MAG: hypothetical protein ABIU05_02980 [Nitrospirales bacterium]